jgi:hypothetical protein
MNYRASILNKVLRKISGPKQDEISEKCGILYNKFHDSYRLAGNFRELKSLRL